MLNMLLRKINDFLYGSSHCWPSAAVGTVVNGGAVGFANPVGWTTFITAGNNTTSKKIVSAVVEVAAAGTYELDIGHGSAGNEVADTTIRFLGTGRYVITPCPKIPNGVRMAMRVRSAAGGVNPTISIEYID